MVCVTNVTLAVRFETYGCRVTAHTGVTMATTVHFHRKTTAQTKDSPGFWGVLLLVVICLALLMLALNNEDFSQTLELIGQY